MELRLTAGSVEVIVWDSDPTIPAAWTADPGRVGRHGLEIVEAVTEELSVGLEPVGKRITARIALSDARDGHAATGSRREGGPLKALVRTGKRFGRCPPAGTSADHSVFTARLTSEGTMRLRTRKRPTSASSVRAR